MEKIFQRKIYSVQERQSLPIPVAHAFRPEVCSPSGVVTVAKPSPPERVSYRMRCCVGSGQKGNDGQRLPPVARPPGLSARNVRITGNSGMKIIVAFPRVTIPKALSHVFGFACMALDGVL